MADREGDGHPILSGVAALVAVTVVVGLILGGGALAAAKLGGVDGGTSVVNPDDSKSATLDLPRFTDPTDDLQTSFTLASPEPTSSSIQPSSQPTSSAPAKTISLSAGETSVSPMQNIDLSGTYPGGDGEVLQVQRRTDGAWGDFPITISVSGGTFSTYIQTGQTGVNQLRVVDTDTGKKSNVVKVKVG